jgi:hypothetical protein
MESTASEVTTYRSEADSTISITEQTVSPSNKLSSIVHSIIKDTVKEEVLQIQNRLEASLAQQEEQLLKKITKLLTENHKYK